MGCSGGCGGALGEGTAPSWDGTRAGGSSARPKSICPAKSSAESALCVLNQFDSLLADGHCARV